MRNKVVVRERTVLIECRALLDFFKYKGLLDHWRVSVSGILRNDNFLTPNREMAGFSDIIILLPIPRTIFLELKAENGKQSDNQKKFQTRVEAMGHKYYLCKSREELCKILEENSVPVKLFIR